MIELNLYLTQQKEHIYTLFPGDNFDEDNGPQEVNSNPGFLISRLDAKKYFEVIKRECDTIGMIYVKRVGVLVKQKYAISLKDFENFERNIKEIESDKYFIGWVLRDDNYELET